MSGFMYRDRRHATEVIRMTYNGGKDECVCFAYDRRTGAGASVSDPAGVIMSGMTDETIRKSGGNRKLAGKPGCRSGEGARFRMTRH